jgi:hypothetical protein
MWILCEAFFKVLIRKVLSLCKILFVHTKVWKLQRISFHWFTYIWFMICHAFLDKTWKLNKRLNFWKNLFQNLTKFEFDWQVTNYLLDTNRLLDDDQTYRASLEIEPKQSRLSNVSLHPSWRMGSATTSGGNSWRLLLGTMTPSVTTHSTLSTAVVKATPYVTEKTSKIGSCCCRFRKFALKAFQNAFWLLN